MCVCVGGGGGGAGRVWVCGWVRVWGGGGVCERGKAERGGKGVGGGSVYVVGECGVVCVSVSVCESGGVWVRGVLVGVVCLGGLVLCGYESVSVCEEWSVVCVWSECVCAECECV